MRRSMNRVRHLPTVALLRPKRAAIELLTSPSALLRTRRARALSDAGSERLRANEESCARSSCVITNSLFGLPLFIAVSPCKRYLTVMHYLCHLFMGQKTDMVAACQGERIELFGQWHGVMRHKSSAATMDQTDIRGLVTTVHRSVMEAASL